MSCPGCQFLVHCLGHWGDGGEGRIGLAQCSQCRKYSVVREVSYETRKNERETWASSLNLPDYTEYLDYDYPQIDYLPEGCRRLFSIQNYFKCDNCINWRRSSRYL